MISLNIYSQVTSIVPLSTINAPNGAYLKDLDDELLPYVGTWEGMSNNKKYTFVFEKFTQKLFFFSNEHYFYRDKIKAKLKVIDLATNEVLYNGLSAIDYDDFPIYGVSRPHRG